jgi:2-phosphosulfolactate phosphatase
VPRAVDVSFTVAGARQADLTVVIDVLRATTTIVQALAGGYERVLCVDTLERALALGGTGRVLAGERRCVRPPGFDLGNSPAEMAPPRGAELVLATTNGAPAIVRAAALSRVVLIASLRNLAAAADAARASEDVLVLCAGTDGRPSLEDTYVAGRLAEAVGGSPTDAARIAVATARAHAHPHDALSAGAGARALVEANLSADIEFCAQESVTDVVPAVESIADGVAVVQKRGL